MNKSFYVWESLQFWSRLIWFKNLINLFRCFISSQHEKTEPAWKICILFIVYSVVSKFLCNNAKFYRILCKTKERVHEKNDALMIHFFVANGMLLTEKWNHRHSALQLCRAESHNLLLQDLLKLILFNFVFIGDECKCVNTVRFLTKFFRQNSSTATG